MKKRLLYYLNENNISREEFCEKVVIANSTLDSDKVFSPLQLYRISRAYKELNIDWVMFGEGEMKRILN